MKDNIKKIDYDVAEESLGHFYEAIISKSLEKIKSGKKHALHKKLPHVSVISDIVLPNEISPKTAILITHSEAESGTNMKFWRNISETLELRRTYPDLTVINIVFPSNWKQGMLTLMASASDSQMCIPQEFKEQLHGLFKILKTKNAKSVEDYKIEMNNFKNKRFTKLLSGIEKYLTSALAIKPNR